MRPLEANDAKPLADLMVEMARVYGATIDPDLSVADDVLRQSKDLAIIGAAGSDKVRYVLEGTALDHPAARAG